MKTAAQTCSEEGEAFSGGKGCKFVGTWEPHQPSPLLHEKHAASIQGLCLQKLRAGRGRRTDNPPVSTIRRWKRSSSRRRRRRGTRRHQGQNTSGGGRKGGGVSIPGGISFHEKGQEQEPGKGKRLLAVFHGRRVCLNLRTELSGLHNFLGQEGKGGGEGCRGTTYAGCRRTRRLHRNRTPHPTRVAEIPARVLHN